MDDQGTIIKTYSYDAFGTEISKDNNQTDNNPFRYCGEYHDIETGYIYLRARYYNPVVGRFTTEDPIRADQKGGNYYVYCGNDPINRVDPSGLKYIIAWSYGTKDAISFEKYWNKKQGTGMNHGGNTSKWDSNALKDFNKRSSFARAAKTKRRDLLKQPGISKKDITLKRIDSRAGLQKQWKKWAKMKVVEGLDFYSHGHPGGADVKGGSGSFWKSAKKLKWGSMWRQGKKGGYTTSPYF